jgi:cytochrome b6-f complex iron-sulfur subunit
MRRKAASRPAHDFRGDLVASARLALYGSPLSGRPMDAIDRACSHTDPIPPESGGVMADLESGAGAAPGSGTPATRRQFLTWMSRAFLGLWAVGGAGVVAAYMGSPDRNEGGDRRVRVGNLNELRIGEARLVRHGVTPFFVIRTNETTVVALSAVCTHVRCILNYDRERRTIVCPCHDGRFDLKGTVLSGPPPRPLPAYEVSLRAGEVYVRV